MSETFGDRLREKRKELRLSQPRLAELCGWDSQSRVSMYEMNKRVPRPADVERLAKALKTSPEHLLFGNTDGTSVMDIEILALIIELADEVVYNLGFEDEWSSTKKAWFIATMYEEFLDKGRETITKDNVVTFAKLARKSYD